MFKTIRPIEPHSSSIGTEVYPFLSIFADNIFSDEITATTFNGYLNGTSKLSEGLTEEAESALINKVLEQI